MIKVAVCCIGRQENRYINEFIDYYISIGVDKIFIYDNNYDGEEYFEDVIPKSILNKKVEIIDYRNQSFVQLKCYQDCYDKHNSEYDWMLFVDCDEYFYMNGFNNIKNFLSQDKFNKFDMIHVNIMNYGDDNQITYENKLLRERFVNPILPLNWKKNYQFSENNHISSLVRGRLNDVKWIATPHTPHGNLRCCDASGLKCDSHSPFLEFDFTYAHFKHYTTKTIEEWLDIKTKRGFPDGNKDYFKKINIIDDFFKANEVTEKKLKYIESKGFNVDYLYERIK